MAICTIIAGLYMDSGKKSINEQGHKFDPNGQSNDVLVLICILAYVCFSSLGFLVIPWTLIGELLPFEVRHTPLWIPYKSLISFLQFQVRGKLSGFVISITYIMMFFVIKIFPFALDCFELRGIFYIFSCNCLMAVLLIYWFLPETLGKSFSEIQAVFMTRADASSAPNKCT